jgi:septum formation protein
MLARIAGRAHEVWGGIAIAQRAKKINQVWSHVTQVTMAAMTKAEIERYVRTGEPMDKAGAYAIQGIGLQFVDTVQGSYSNVVGLNICALMERLKKCGAVR